MRTSRRAPLAAVLLLAACGGSSDSGEEQSAAAGGGDDVAAGDEAEGVPSGTVAVAASRLAQPLPGEYRTTVELLEFEVPGMQDLPPAVRQQMQGAIGAKFMQAGDFCLTPEEAKANGPQKMAENLAQSNCTMEKFNVSGNTIVADLSCKGDATGEGAGRMRMEGQMNPESSVMTMTLDREGRGGGPSHLMAKVTSERTGECS